MFSDLLKKIFGPKSIKYLLLSANRMIGKLNDNDPNVRNQAIAGLRKLAKKILNEVDRESIISSLESADRFYNSGSCGPGRNSEGTSSFQPYKAMIQFYRNENK
ncbi:MAG: hypothetical protein KKD07_07875 [Candidatus Omnitrophica bacterium]|nr:hypothetical protein [Candidatus Omnitrophota bacterium]MBU1997206.1 hypothetical protein [Candidatus Omnitrophota bacterium]MBU4334340.1 hypothetical protein [Candidatus Omnitrophota bacterium]